jgi:toxin ParE1/3/4
VPLCHHPRAGAKRDTLAPGLRVTFHRKYAIYFLHRAEDLVIVPVLHGARDIAAIARSGGFTDAAP